MEQRFFFRKEERLCSRKIIDLLFREKSNSIFVHPLRFSWISAPIASRFPAQVLITVSRKKFRSAVHRNRIKRQLREIYRKNKHIIYDLLSSANGKYALSLAYVADNPSETIELEKAFMRIIDRLAERLN